MKLDNILSVSGYPGLYRLVTTRSNGLIIEDFDSGKRSFISLRKHQFTPLESVGIYTYTDVVGLEDIFKTITSNGESLPDSGADASQIHTYFRKILPEYDEDRVYLSDIKKVIKWYAFLHSRNLLTAAADEEE